MEKEPGYTPEYDQNNYVWHSGSLEYTPGKPEYIPEYDQINHDGYLGIIPQSIVLGNPGLHPSITKPTTFGTRVPQILWGDASTYPSMTKKTRLVLG